jgi:branched-chain amino acid transport system ATP-binding protein
MKLELKNIAHAFGGNIILENCSYTFTKGKIYSIQGNNGVGKTTLLNIINGFTKPKKGVIILNDNYEVSKNSVNTSNRKGILRLWQKGEVFKNMSVIDNLNIVSKHKGENLLNYIFKYKEVQQQENLINEKAQDVLKLLTLWEKRGDLVRNLSFGQQRLVAFGRLLMDERIKKGKTVILLDEPFSGIHSDIIEIISSKIKEIAQLGNIIIIIEHNFERLHKVADIQLELKNKTLKTIIDD